MKNIKTKKPPSSLNTITLGDQKFISVTNAAIYLGRCVVQIRRYARRGILKSEVILQGKKKTWLIYFDSLKSFNAAPRGAPIKKK